MKKIILLFILIVSVLTLSACSLNLPFDLPWEKEEGQTPEQINVNVQVSHTHGYELVSEIPATCTESGTKAYYKCACGKIFDIEKNEIEVVERIPATGHRFNDYVEEVPATTSSFGIKGYYHCANCGKDFDQTKKNELNSLLINPIKEEEIYELHSEFANSYLQSNTTYIISSPVAEVPYIALDRVYKLPFSNPKGSFTGIIFKGTNGSGFYNKIWYKGPDTDYGAMDGNTWFNSGDYKIITTGEITDKIREDLGSGFLMWFKSATTHDCNLTHYEEKEPSCCECGYSEHDYCPVCGKSFNGDGEEITPEIFNALGHNKGDLIEESEEYIEHYFCTRCGEFLDENNNALSNIYRTFSENGKEYFYYDLAGEKLTYEFANKYEQPLIPSYSILSFNWIMNDLTDIESVEIYYLPAFWINNGEKFDISHFFVNDGKIRFYHIDLRTDYLSYDSTWTTDFYRTLYIKKINQEKLDKDFAEWILENSTILNTFYYCEGSETIKAHYFDPFKNVYRDSDFNEIETLEELYND